MLVRMLHGLVLFLIITLMIAMVYIGHSYGQTLDPVTVKRYKRVLPMLDDPSALEIINNPRSIWYTSQTMGVRYQAFDRESLQGVFSAFQNVDAGNDPFGNGNREYPWAPTLGGGSFDRDVARVKTMKIILLPLDHKQRQLPVIMLRQQRPKKWSFPTGTQVLEFGFQVGPDDWYPFETRFRMREPNDWQTERFMPLGTRDALVKAVAEVDPDLAARIPRGKVTRVRIRAAHSRPSINSHAVVQVLPDFPTSLTARLLRDSVQYPMSGHLEWAPGIDGPTTKQSFHIRPAGDLTANHGMGSREQCRQCHQDIDKHVRTNFESNRGWYGDIRGSDGIFSFWPEHEFFRRTGIVVDRRDLKHDQKKYYQWSKFLVAELTEANR